MKKVSEIERVINEILARAEKCVVKSVSKT